MESALLGLVLDSSPLITAERRKLRPDQAIEMVRMIVGEVSIVLCSITVAEIGHGIYRAGTSDMRQQRRRFLDELIATVPVHPVTEATAEIIARIGGEQAAKGINLPLADLIIGLARWNSALPWAPVTSATLNVFPIWRLLPSKQPFPLTAFSPVAVLAVQGKAHRRVPRTGPLRAAAINVLKSRERRKPRPYNSCNGSRYARWFLLSRWCSSAAKRQLASGLQQF